MLALWMVQTKMSSRTLSRGTMNVVHADRGDKEFCSRNFGVAKFCYGLALCNAKRLYVEKEPNADKSVVATLIELYYKTGLTSLHLSRQVNDDLQEFQVSIEAFNESLDWCRFDSSAHSRNVQVILSILFY